MLRPSPGPKSATHRESEATNPMTRIAIVAISLAFGLQLTASGQSPVAFSLAGDWAVEVTVRRPTPKQTVIRVTPPQPITVSSERFDSLPIFNPKTGGWLKGVRLAVLKAQETTTPYLLDPASLVLRAAADLNSAAFTKGEDYDADLTWGTVGRLSSGRITEGQPVYASYRYAPLRLDAVVLTRGGEIVLRPGEPCAAAPAPPGIGEGEQHLGNIWIPGRLAKLGPNNLFPILENAFPESSKTQPAPAERLLPKTLRKLRSGERLRLLAWGDSVTVGSYLPDPSRERWQEQFERRLRERFSKSNIELLTEAWGGRNTGSYLAEPPGSEHNYRNKILGAKPDLIVSEFVNDAGLNPAQVEERYSKLLADFQGIGAEWIILTPHYVRRDWMNLTRERDIDEDQRPYVAGLRQFATQHNVALADAARRYGRLWRQGLPYSTLLLNSINHPDARGMKIFADALMELSP